MKSVLSFFACLTAAGLLADVKDMNWRRDAYEPKTPVLTGSVADGLHGSVTPMRRVDHWLMKTLTGTERAWRATAWRNERVHGQFVVWTRESAEQLRLSHTDLVAADGSRIPASACATRFLRYVFSSFKDHNDIVKIPETIIGDCLDTAETLDLPPNGYRPFWFTVNVPENQKPGTYVGRITARVKGNKTVTFTVAVEVLGKTLPAPKDWKFFLDLWQHPLAVARYHGVKPWSKDHYALLRPLLEALADMGQKTITTTLTDLPWNHQNFDPYYTMVKHTKNADGTWTRDFALFDAYVTFAQSCGIGPQIHCYTMVTWGNIIYYTDGATGDKIAVKLIPGTPEHEAFWGPFLVDFEKHVREKGWLGNVYIAIDERSREELMASANILKKYAPGLKIQMAGNKPPSTFKGIEVHNYSQGMRANYVSPEFKAEVKERRAKGFVTTTYICCNPAQPNTFTFSPYAQQHWLGLYAAAQGFDGMLRWAAFNWPRDPFFDSSYNPHHGSWKPGDTYLVYPGCRYSVRWENLRDSIENFEKIRILRAEGKAGGALEAALSKIDYTKEAASAGESYFIEKVSDVEDAIVKASR